MKKVYFCLPVVLAITLLAVACNGTAVTTTTNTTTPQAGTFGSLAQSGEMVFANNCARCHGITGGGFIGPAIIGDTTIPQRYSSADQLLTFIQTNMPQDKPGTLITEQYQQVLSYLMVQNNYVDAQTMFEAGSLDQVPINR